MNYVKIYDEICASAKRSQNVGESLQNDVCGDVIPEVWDPSDLVSHLIVPAGIWGSHDTHENRIILTRKQQIVAYLLLVKIYPYAKHIAVTLKKLQRIRGKKRPSSLIVHRRRSAAMKKARRRPHSAETRAKMSESHKGKTFSDASKEKMSLAKRGKSMTDEHVRKRNEARKIGGSWFSDEAREKMRLAALARGKRKIEPTTGNGWITRGS